MATNRASRASSSRPYEVLFQMVIGKWISQALGTVVEIGVPEQLAKGARRCSDIAREAGVSEDGIYRLLRALASVGLFVESADRRFKLTRMGKLLQSDHPESLRLTESRKRGSLITWLFLLSKDSHSEFSRATSNRVLRNSPMTCCSRTN